MNEREWRERQYERRRYSARPTNGRPRRYVNCDICAKFKSRPSSVCSWCGNDPVSHNGSRRAYDCAHGFED